MTKKEFKKFDKIIAECKTSRHYFWEFYAQYHLWFYLASGKEVLGFKQDFILNHCIVNRINNRFSETVNTFLKMVKDALEKSIRSEMKYIFSPDIGEFYDAISSVDSHWNVGEYTRSEIDRTQYVARKASTMLTEYLKQYDTKIIRNISPQKAPISWAKIAFNWDGWSDSYCGKPWANACNVFLDLNNVKSLRDKIYWIDRALDLYHNNGFLLNKTPFATLEAMGDLSLRAALSDWKLALKENEFLKTFIIIEDKERMEYLIEQDKYPLSKYTTNLIKKYL